MHIGPRNGLSAAPGKHVVRSNRPTGINVRFKFLLRFQQLSVTGLSFNSAFIGCDKVLPRPRAIAGLEGNLFTSNAISELPSGNRLAGFSFIPPTRPRWPRKNSRHVVLALGASMWRTATMRVCSQSNLPISSAPIWK